MCTSTSRYASLGQKYSLTKDFFHSAMFRIPHRGSTSTGYIYDRVRSTQRIANKSLGLCSNLSSFQPTPDQTRPDKTRPDHPIHPSHRIWPISFQKTPIGTRNEHYDHPLPLSPLLWPKVWYTNKPRIGQLYQSRNDMTRSRS